MKPEIQSDVWSFLGGIARKNGCKALIVVVKTGRPKAAVPT
jgi:hypothetical protein